MCTKKNIFILDDEESIATLLKTVLGVYGYQCETATMPRFALERIKETLPDAVILDVAMPDMDGYEVCYALKRDARTRHIPVLFVTALSLIQDKRKAIECGAEGFIFKPFNPQDVISEIGRLVS